MNIDQQWWDRCMILTYFAGHEYLEMKDDGILGMFIVEVELKVLLTDFRLWLMTQIYLSYKAALPTWVAQTPVFKVILDGASEATRAQIIIPRQYLALIDTSNKVLGIQLPWSGHQMLPWIPASKETIMAVWWVQNNN